MKYRLLPQALIDLELIGDYIAEHNPNAAVRLVDTLERRWDLLTLHPFSGAARRHCARHSPSSRRRISHLVPCRRGFSLNPARAAWPAQYRGRRRRLVIFSR
ncbi:type II toxin-antitoxin system RelE/ParE family toxin [Mesorhizobium sp. ISC15]|uniref:type II toxin-antitoxin system RelE/ParE family toxin n=1 Tax=Mesorhizobium sp. ISC15 TaxID=3076429 RepID=UPI00301C70DB